jgi:hypothetical protein
LLAGLLVLQAALLLWAAWRNSVTYDEAAHIAVGCAYWRYGEFTLYSLSPPLARLWYATGALLAGANVPSPAAVAETELLARHFHYSWLFQQANPSNYHEICFAARLLGLPLAALTTIVLYRCARRLFGRRAGTAAAAVFVLLPDAAAHFSLATTDAWAVLTIVFTLWRWNRFCERPGVRNWTIVSLAIAAAHLCKFTAFVLWPAMLVMAVVQVLCRNRQGGRLFIGLIAAAAASVAVINVVYGFDGTFRRIGDCAFRSEFLKAAQATLPAWTPTLLPRIVLDGFDIQKFDTERGYPAMIWGEVYRGARWYYYPLLLACKLPLAILGLTAVAIWMSAFPIGAARHRAARLGMLVGVLATGAFLINLVQINIGTRYLLPAIVGGCILLGAAWRSDVRAKAAVALRGTAAALLAGLAVEHATIAPNYLSFVNLAVGGPWSGYRLVNDSNYDWGQGLIELRECMQRERIDRVSLLYFGSVDPALYGICYTPITQSPFEPVVAISSYFMVGLNQVTPTPEGPSERVALRAYRDLQKIRPRARAGHTLFLFDQRDLDPVLDK